MCWRFRLKDFHLAHVNKNKNYIYTFVHPFFSSLLFWFLDQQPAPHRFNFAFLFRINFQIRHFSKTCHEAVLLSLTRLSLILVTCLIYLCLPWAMLKPGEPQSISSGSRDSGKTFFSHKNFLEKRMDWFWWMDLIF